MPHANREDDLVRRWAARAGRRPDLEVGIGDDAAVIRCGRRRAIVTTDTIVEGVDFAPGTPATLVGRKAAACSLSDCAAMGCAPAHLFLNFLLPPRRAAACAQSLFRGAARLAARYGAVVAGGDLSRTEGPLAVTATLVGLPPPGRRPIRRFAKAGDRLLVSGPLGGSILGKHLRFYPRIREALALQAECRPRGLMDLSDGLSTDLPRFLPKGLAAELDAPSIPISAAAQRLARRTGRAALEHALHDGEDFELLLALPPSSAHRVVANAPGGCRWREIGRAVPGRGIFLLFPEGRRRRLLPGGFDHLER